MNDSLQTARWSGMRPHWTVLLCVILLWPSVTALAATTPLQSPKSVLVLYPERPDTPAHLLLDQGLRSTLTAKITDRLDFYAEYLDISRFPGEEHLHSLSELYRRKYAGRTVDLIVAVTRRPLEFLLRHQQELFPGTPVVFCGVDPDTLTNLSVPPHMTGTVRHLDFKGTLTLALTLHPRTKRVALLSGTSPTGHYYRTLAQAQLRDFEGMVEFIELGPLPISALLEQVARLPEETIILYALLFRDGAGHSFLGPESVSLVAQAANAPLYSVFDTLLGSGTVGGHMYSYEAVGKQVAELGTRLLAGEQPAPLPPPGAGTNVYLFDWRQLKRWGIGEGKLPPGSTIRYQELSVWAQYREYIIGSVLLCLVEALLIVALLLQRRQRKQLERWLAERLRFEMLSTDLSSSFINLSPDDDLGKPILHGLQRVTEFLGGDRGNLSEFVEAADVFRVRYSWAVEGFEPLPTVSPVGQYPWCLEQLRQGHVIQCASLEELPEAAAVDRESFREAGTKSVILVPLIAGGTILGSLSCGSLRAERTWTDTQAQWLRFLGEIFAHVLLRQRAEQALRDSKALSSAVLASLRGLVAVIDRRGMIVAVNGAWTHLAREYQTGSLANICVGANYLEVCRRAVQANDLMAIEALAGIESVLSGSSPGLPWEYRCPLPGGEVWYMMTVEPLRRPEGGAVISHLDITERKHAEMAAQRHQQELAHVARVAMMGELTASLAHELYHPLGAILSNTQAAQHFLAAESPDIEEVRAILADIVEDDQRAVEVIRRLRRFLKQGERESLPLDLNQVIREVVQLLHSDALMRHVTITSELYSDLPPVCGDRVQLQQVLLNLMLNGSEAMAAQPIEDRILVVRSRLSGAHQVEVAVQDRGGGLDPDQIEHIFEAFYTTKTDGMGMGLAICRSIVEAHGGRLWAVNNPDREATLSLTLPVSKEDS